MTHIDQNDPENKKSLYSTAPKADEDNDSLPANKPSPIEIYSKNKQEDFPFAIKCSSNLEQEVTTAINTGLYKISKSSIDFVRDRKTNTPEYEKASLETVEKLCLFWFRKVYEMGLNHGKITGVSSRQ